MRQKIDRREVKIRVMKDGVEIDRNIYNRGAPLTLRDYAGLRKLALKGDVEYINDKQVGLDL